LFAAPRQSPYSPSSRVQRLANKRRRAISRDDVRAPVSYTRNERGLCMFSGPQPSPEKMETNMTTYFTIGDFILVIPMALAGALFVGALPCKTELRHNALRVIGALIGVICAVALVEGLPALV